MYAPTCLSNALRASDHTPVISLKCKPNLPQERERESEREGAGEGEEEEEEGRVRTVRRRTRVHSKGSET